MHLLVKLGCAKQADLEVDMSPEFKKAEEVWSQLLKCQQLSAHLKL